LSEPRPHVATIDFPEFYAETMGSLEAARAFYDSVSHTGSEAGRTAKTILNQAARMVWLADRIDAFSRGRPALQIMFYMIAAEAVAKLAAGYDGEKQSKFYVRQFFTKYCSDAQRHRIYRALEWASPMPPSSSDEVVDYLYEIRRHRGRVRPRRHGQGLRGRRRARLLRIGQERRPRGTGDPQAARRGPMQHQLPRRTRDHRAHEHHGWRCGHRSRRIVDAERDGTRRAQREHRCPSAEARAAGGDHRQRRSHGGTAGAKCDGFGRLFPSPRCGVCRAGR